MGKKLIFCFVFQLPLLVFAQFTDFSWVQSKSTTIDERATLDKAGNFYVAGKFTHSVDFDPSENENILTSPNYYGKLFIEKIDPNGNLLWVKSFGGDNTISSSGITLDKDGNIYISGLYEGIMDFDPGAGVFELPEGDNLDIFLLKLNNNGEFLWAFGLGTYGLDTGSSLITDSQGNVYLTGSYYDDMDFDPGPSEFILDFHDNQSGFILKMDPNGDFMWVNRLVGHSTNNVAIDPTDNIYLVNYTTSTVTFENDSIHSFGGNDICLQKFSSNGDRLWIKTMGGAGNDYGKGIALDSSNNVYISGSFIVVADFDPLPTSNKIKSKGETDAFIQKFDSDGNVIWVKVFGGIGNDLATNLCILKDSLIIVTGGFSVNVDFDPSLNTAIENSLGSLDGYLAKFTIDGDFVDVEPYGSSYFDYGRSLHTDTVGNIYLHSNYAGEITFDTQNGPYFLDCFGSYFLLKLGESTFNPIDDEDDFVDNNLFFWTYPNPTSGMIYIEQKNLSGFGFEVLSFSYTIYDVAGKPILSSDSNSNITPIDLSQFASGIYSIKVIEGNNSQVFKISKY
jgi:hypothetical protein